MVYYTIIFLEDSVFSHSLGVGKALAIPLTNPSSSVTKGV